MRVILKWNVLKSKRYWNKFSQNRWSIYAIYHYLWVVSPQPGLRDSRTCAFQNMILHLFVPFFGQISQQVVFLCLYTTLHQCLDLQKKILLLRVLGIWCFLVIIEMRVKFYVLSFSKIVPIFIERNGRSSWGFGCVKHANSIRIQSKAHRFTAMA